MSSPSDLQPLCGVLIIDKPEGMSSMGVCARVRRRAGRGRRFKVGHAGTLDPLATGVLVLALGRATKSLGVLMTATTKRYETTIDLSAFTATDDREGELEPVNVDKPPTEDAVREALTHFTGAFMQAPPSYSAVKVNGRRAYALARAGKTPELAPRAVFVHDLQLAAYDWPLVTLDLTCDKGLYVRRLARDLGARLRTGGYCTRIHRTAVGPFTIDEAHSLDDVPEPLTSEALLPLDEALARVTNE